MSRRQSYQEWLTEPERTPAPGLRALAMAGMVIGILLLSMQLWFLTIALELYLAGEGEGIWLLALVSGLVFLGGAAMLRTLSRRPEVGRRQS